MQRSIPFLLMMCASAWGAPVELSCKFNELGPNRSYSGTSVDVTFDELAGTAQSFDGEQTKYPKQIRYPSRVDAPESLKNSVGLQYSRADAPVLSRKQIQLCNTRVYAADEPRSTEKYCYEISREDGSFILSREFVTRLGEFRSNRLNEGYCKPSEKKTGLF